MVVIYEPIVGENSMLQGRRKIIPAKVVALQIMANSDKYSKLVNGVQALRKYKGTSRPESL